MQGETLHEEKQASQALTALHAHALQPSLCCACVQNNLAVLFVCRMLAAAATPPRGLLGSGAASSVHHLSSPSLCNLSWETQSMPTARVVKVMTCCAVASIAARKFPCACITSKPVLCLPSSVREPAAAIGTSTSVREVGPRDHGRRVRPLKLFRCCLKEF